MFTWKDIFKNATDHPIGIGGQQSVIKHKDLKISLVGGREGLYGDFFTTFELAIIRDSDFVTKEILNVDDDVIGYLSIDDVVKILNKIENEY